MAESLQGLELGSSEPTRQEMGGAEAGTRARSSSPGLFHIAMPPASEQWGSPFSRPHLSHLSHGASFLLLCQPESRGRSLCSFTPTSSQQPPGSSLHRWTLCQFAWSAIGSTTGRGLEQQTSIVSQFWRLKVRDQGVSGLVPSEVSLLNL